MILIDRRKGSGEFLPRLERMGAAVESTELAFGDFAL